MKYILLLLLCVGCSDKGTVIQNDSGKDITLLTDKGWKTVKDGQRITATIVSTNTGQPVKMKNDEPDIKVGKPTRVWTNSASAFRR